MHTLVIERRQAVGARSLATDLAERLVDNVYQGKAVVVSDKPVALLSAVRKQWLRAERKIWNERARTLSAARISELTSQLAYMEQISFTAKPPDDFLEADITFATADDFIRVAPDCKTMFVTYDFPRLKLHMITSWMPRNGVVVIYG